MNETTPIVTDVLTLEEVIADEDVAFAEESKFSGGLNTWEF